MKNLQVLPAVLLAGCVWTQFDDLKDDVWVDSVGAIEGSSKYGEAVIEANAGPASGGTRLAVIGRNQASVSGLVYQQDGSRSINRIALGDMVTLIVAFEENPVVAADPASDQFAFAALTGAVTEMPTLRGLKVGVFAGATYAGAGYEPSQTSFPQLAMNHTQPSAMAFGTSTEALIGRRDQLLHVGFTGQPGLWAGCSFMNSDDETAYGIAYGDVTGDLVPEWVIASAPIGVDAGPDPGRIWYLPTAATPTDPTGAAFCREPGANEVVVSGGGSEFPLGPGTQLKIEDLGAGPRVLVSSPGTGGKLTIVDFTGTPAAAPTFTEITVGTAVGDIGPFAVADITADNPGVELIIGAPGADDAGPTRAGVVRILKPDGTPAVANHLLYDANPETEQHFGKSLAVVPYGPAPVPPAVQPKVLVVGAEGEVFTYFRTTFYDEVRAGR